MPLQEPRSSWYCLLAAGACAAKAATVANAAPIGILMITLTRVTNGGDLGGPGGTRTVNLFQPVLRANLQAKDEKTIFNVTRFGRPVPCSIR